MHVWGEASSNAFTTLTVVSAAALLTAGADGRLLVELSDGGSQAATSGCHTKSVSPEWKRARAERGT
jgi:hypothetical protein